jgi:hypothetical protein
MMWRGFWAGVWMLALLIVLVGLVWVYLHSGGL